MTENDLFQITVTNRKRYVGLCNFDGCDWRTNVESLRLNAAVKVRDHCRIVHGSYAADLFLKRESMKTPGKELPPLERLNEYVDHLVVFADAETGKTKSQFGVSVVDCLVWVYVKENWKSLGQTPIFWGTVGRQIEEADGETIGGYLRQGNSRSKAEFWLETPTDKADLALLKSWEKDHETEF